MFQFLQKEMHRWHLSSVSKEGTFQDLLSGRHGVVLNNGGEEQQGILSLQDTSSATINFRDSCISNPSLCEQGLSVSFWLRHKRKLPSRDVIKLMQAFLEVDTLPLPPPPFREKMSPFAVKGRASYRNACYVLASFLSLS